MDSPFSLRDAYMDVGSRAPTVGALGDAGAVAEKVRMRGSNKAFCLIFILLSPTLSSRMPTWM
jgi:hypothetical protein